MSPKGHYTGYSRTGRALPEYSDRLLECPEFGYVSMHELRDLRGPLGLPIVRELHFDALKTLSPSAGEVGALQVRCPKLTSAGAYYCPSSFRASLASGTHS